MTDSLVKDRSRWYFWALEEISQTCELQYELRKTYFDRFSCYHNGSALLGFLSRPDEESIRAPRLTQSYLRGPEDKSYFWPPG